MVAGHGASPAGTMCRAAGPSALGFWDSDAVPALAHPKISLRCESGPQDKAACQEPLQGLQDGYSGQASGLVHGTPAFRKVPTSGRHFGGILGSSPESAY